MFALFAFGTLSIASQAGEKISLIATAKHPVANGTVVIRTYLKKNLDI
jgi:hypothetical protein